MLKPEKLQTLRSAATPWPTQKPSIKGSRLAWFHRAHSQVFNRLCSRYRTGTYLELGSWTGIGSTRYVLDHFPKMNVIAIDTFEGSAEHQRRDEWKEIASHLWEHFCVNVWPHRERVFPFRAKTIEAMEHVASLGIQPDLVYIDAAHDKESVYQDLKAAMSCFPGAVIIGDDYTPEHLNKHPDVRLALDRAIQEGLMTAKEFQHYGRVWNLTRNLQ